MTRWLAVLSLLVALAPSAALAAEPPPQFGVLRRIASPTSTPELADLPSNPLATPTPKADEPSPTPTAEPTMPEKLELPDFAARIDAVKGGVVGRQLLLEVPPRSQFDGTPFQSSNCGPAALAMVLDAFGLKVDTFKLRNYVNVLTGDRSPENGVALESLAAVAIEAGLRVEGARGPWTVSQIREQVRHGHPVITLVKLRELPDHAGSGSQVDHYVVVVGLDGEDLLINDPASTVEGGHRRPLTPAELERAWAASSVPGQALAVAGGKGIPELSLPDPAEPPAWLVPFVPADAEDRREWSTRRRAALERSTPAGSDPAPLPEGAEPPPICRLVGELALCRPDGAT